MKCFRVRVAIYNFTCFRESLRAAPSAPAAIFFTGAGEIPPLRPWAAARDSPKCEKCGFYEDHKFGEFPHILRHFTQKQKKNQLGGKHTHTLARATVTFHALGAKSKNTNIFSQFNEIPQNVRKSANFVSSPPKAASVSWSRRITPVLEAGGGPGAPFAHFAPKGAISAQNMNLH